MHLKHLFIAVPTAFLILAVARQTPETPSTTWARLLDPLVRIEAARLREKLREDHETDGQGDPIRIDLPKGTYAAPRIEIGEGEQRVKSLPKRRMRWQTTVPVLALILVLGAVGAWLDTGTLGAGTQRCSRELWARRVQWTGDRGPSLCQFERRPATRVFQRRLDRGHHDKSCRRAASDLHLLAHNTTFQYKGKAWTTQRSDKSSECAMCSRAASGAPMTEFLCHVATHRH